MRKLVVGTFLTLDGVMQAPGGLRTGEVEVGRETVIFDQVAAHKSLIGP
ncbi:MAG: hypothetical protein HYU77_10590 [Betaproteobacteria bacterium]|nr:hypothetical protein [Betaproteobacteria bacterium]